MKLNGLHYFFRFLRDHSINQSILIESQYIIEWRKRYIKDIRKYRAEGHSTYYIDESYINSHHRPSKILTDTTVTSSDMAKLKNLSTGIPRLAGAGPRCIMMAAGDEDGFVPRSAVIKKRTPKDGVVSEDYHSDVCAENFESWLKSWLSLIPPKSVIVMDNASYHSKKIENQTPKASWRKKQLQDWLDIKEIHYEKKAKKDQLWALARSKSKANPRFRVDEIIREYGHICLRLPPYGCDLNPIERI